MRPPRDRRLVPALVAWLVSALLIVGLFVVSVPVYFEYLRTQCFSLACPAGPDFTPDPQEMEALGLSVDFYAAYFATIESAFTLVYVALAAFVFWRRSDEWMALLGAFTLLAWGTTFTNPQAALAEVHPGWWFPVACITYVGNVSFVAFFCLFPDGRFVPGWTRWLALGWAVLSLPTSFFPNAAFGPANWPPALVVGVFAGGLGGLVVAQVYRYRRVSGRVERQQTKLVVFGIAAAVAGFLGSLVLGLIVVPSLQNSPLGGLAGITAIYLALLLVPLSISVAILRYGLWQIDVVINRTLVYGALTAIVAGFYVLVVGVLGALLQAEGNLLISLLAAGLVAVLFAPLRDRLQRGINRLMYGERDEPYAILSRLGERLEATLEPEAVLPAVVETVAQALKLPYAAIALRAHGGENDGFTIAAASGSPVHSPIRLPLVYQHETVGRLVLAPRAPNESFGPADLRLLDDLARQAGIAAHAVLLTADLQRTRERLVTAREEERRRLRRDLHDGLGPQLSSQTLTIDAIRALLRRDPETAEALLLDLKSQAQDAVADIRRLVYGLRPPALDDLGLVDALRETTEQHGAKGLSISVDAPEKLPSLPAAVEVAAYRIAQEAITNVVRHAEAQACAVSLVIDHDASTLCLEVRDDGRGLPDPQESPVRAGVGLTSMRERAAELGGSLTVESLPDGGTLVRARLPLPKEE